MKKSPAVSIPFLAGIAAIAAGCSHPVSVHLNAAGQCISDATGQQVDLQACSAHGGYYGGVHYVYTGSGSASVSGVAAEGTTRGVLGGSAEAHAAGGEGAHGEGAHGGGAGE